MDAIHQKEVAGEWKAILFNTNPRWPAGYFEVLEEAGIKKRRFPLYAHWVRQFFNRYLGTRRRRDLGRSEIDSYLEDLKRDDAVQDWQVRQAADAMDRYYEQFRGIALQPQGDAQSAPPSPRSYKKTPPDAGAPSASRTATNPAHRENGIKPGRDYDARARRPQRRPVRSSLQRQISLTDS